MKQVILEINNCLECPFNRYIDQYDDWRAEDLSHQTLKEGWYCTKKHPSKFISGSYNANGEIDIPKWCELKDA